jgi:hypothetical protein
LNATMYSIDQSTSPIPVDSVSLEGSTLKFVVDAVGGTYEGKVSATVKPAHHDHVAKVTSTSRPRFRFPQRELLTIEALPVAKGTSTGYERALLPEILQPLVVQVTISYCGHVAFGSRFTIGCEPEIGTMGRRYGLPTVIWQE